jgi:Mrp family chromosome partitioning ATPase
LRLISNDSIALALDDDVQGELVPFAFTDIGRAEMEQDEKTRDQAAAAVGAIGFAGGLSAAVYWCVHNQDACADDIEQMQEAADIVVVDTPPVLAVADGLELAGTVDATLLVVRSGKTRRRLAERARDQLKRVEARLLGVVVNAIPQDTESYYYGYQYVSRKPQPEHRNGTAKPAEAAKLVAGER